MGEAGLSQADKKANEVRQADPRKSDVIQVIFLSNLNAPCVSVVYLNTLQV